MATYAIEVPPYLRNGTRQRYSHNDRKTWNEFNGHISCFNLSMASIQKYAAHSAAPADETVTTRSQAVASIADRTVSQQTIVCRTLQSKSNGKSKPLTKSEVTSSSSFEDMFDRTPLQGHVTQATPIFKEDYLCARSAFPIQSRVPNMKSLAQVVWEILTPQWLT